MGALLLASQQFLKWLKERLQSSCNLPNILGGKLSLGFIGHAQSSSRRSRSRDIDRTSFRRNAFKRDSGFFTLISTGRGVWIRMEVPSHSHAMRAIRSAVDSSPNSHSSTRLVRGDAGRRISGESEAVSCDNCATISRSEADFLYEIRGDGHMGFRSENPRVGGSIPPLGTLLKDLPLPTSPVSPPNPAESMGVVSLCSITPAARLALVGIGTVVVLPPVTRRCPAYPGCSPRTIRTAASRRRS